MASKIIVDQVQKSGGTAFTLPTSDGSNKSAVITDGSGALSFATGTPSASNFLRGDGTWAAPASATNAPAFSAHRSANQTIASSNTLTKVECDTEVFDSDSKYDNSTDYRFTPGTIGKYYVSCQIQMANSLGDNISDCQICIYKNGVIFKDSRIVGGDHVYYSPGNFVTLHLNFVMDLNATDYIEMWGAQQEIASSTKWFGVGQQATSFGAYKLIGV